MSARPGYLTVLRDTASFLGGWVLMFKQAGIFFDPPDQFQVWAMLIGAVAAGVPGIAQVLAFRTGTGGSPTSPPEPAPPSPEPSSSIT